MSNQFVSPRRGCFFNFKFRSRLRAVARTLVARTRRLRLLIKFLFKIYPIRTEVEILIVLIKILLQSTRSGPRLENITFLIKILLRIDPIRTGGCDPDRWVSLCVCVWSLPTPVRAYVRTSCKKLLTTWCLVGSPGFLWLLCSLLGHPGLSSALTSPPLGSWDVLCCAGRLRI